MNFQTVTHELIHYFYTFFCWRDALEILFFSALVYHFSLWLKKDTYKNLLGYFYAYCLCFFSAYAAGLSSICCILCVLSPCILMLFMMMHQETLQKNFITLKNINPAKRDTNNWIDILIRSCLIAVNNNKEIICIIEHKDSLTEHLHTNPLQAPVQEELINLIVESTHFDQSKMLWVTSQGTVAGINTHIKPTFAHSWHIQSTSTLDPWKQEALIITAKTDALVFKITPATRTFEFMVQEKQFTNVTAINALLFIKKYISNSSTDFIQGDTIYATQSKGYSTAQRSS